MGPSGGKVFGLILGLPTPVCKRRVTRAPWRQEPEEMEEKRLRRKRK